MQLITSLMFVMLFFATGAANAAGTTGADEPPSRRAADRDYRVNYLVTFEPEKKRALVTVEIPRNPWVKQLTFHTHKVKPANLDHNGKLKRRDDKLVWTPPDKNARLQYTVNISKIRRDDAYDALITPDWVLMRGDNLVPPVKVRQLRGARADAYVRFSVPEDWTSVNTPWRVEDDRYFRITNSERLFERPTGWLVAGKLSTRRERLGSTNLVISGPRGHDFRPMQTLSFLTFIWPTLESAIDQLPENLLITGGNDPFWRGGLSGPDSLYMHSDRPLIGEDGTSTLIHELFHVVTGLRGKPGHDWIAEGLAEFYSIDLLYRAGGLSQLRRSLIMESVKKRAKDVESLLARESKGATTARAVWLFDDLDQELRKVSKDKHDLDDLVNRLDLPGRVDLDDLQTAFHTLTGAQSQTLKQKVLKSRNSS